MGEAKLNTKALKKQSERDMRTLDNLRLEFNDQIIHYSDDEVLAAYREFMAHAGNKRESKEFLTYLPVH